MRARSRPLGVSRLRTHNQKMALKSLSLRFVPAPVHPPPTPLVRGAWRLSAVATDGLRRLLGQDARGILRAAVRFPEPVDTGEHFVYPFSLLSDPTVA